ncbi:MAG: GGDEF domain-containing protein [Sulfurimonas sp.]|nr:GGDEF domain-containing protein [Sulfurimonas sp.]
MLSILILSAYLYKSLSSLKKIEQKFKNLSENISQKESHLKHAQRIAKIGSWEYDLITKKLTLSDEIYRILGIKQDVNIEYNDFLNFINDKDYEKVVTILDDAIKNGSSFNIQYMITINCNKNIHVQTKGKVRKKQRGLAKITAVTMDISSDVKNKQKIKQLAYYDSLTGLANRSLLKDRLSKSIQLASRNKNKLAIIFLDLDYFKLINDNYGHAVGDSLLIYFSNLLKKEVREADTVSRFGGDEFVILLPNIKNIKDAIHIAEKIQNKLQKKHIINSHELKITASMGISIFPNHSKNAEDLIKYADIAMYEAKKDGRNTFKEFSIKMSKYIENYKDKI